MAEARKRSEIKLDPAYKFGAGRYLQGQGVLDQAVSEFARVGKKPYILAGRRAWDATGGRIAEGLHAAGMPYVLDIYGGHCTYEKAREAAAQALAQSCDVIVGVGGGRIMDLAKATGHHAERPVINVPTSIATCAAFPPLSVMYTEAGASLGSLRYEREVAAVLLDLDVIAAEPARYVASGILDGLAKLIEIQNGHSKITIDQFPIDLFTSYTLAQYTTQLFTQRGTQAIEDVRAGRLSKAVEDIAYASVAVTGIISGCSKGFGQSALAHELYELLRTHFTAEAADFLHGEIVAVGLPMQLAFNGQDDQIPALRAQMKAFGMPLLLCDIGVEPTERNLETLFHDLYHSPFVEPTPENELRLRAAMRWLVE